MEILTKEEFEKNKEIYLSEIKGGKIFIYPTDTIYGIGCNAKMGDSVNKIREAKNRDTKPFSIIVPNKNWIKENCMIETPEELDVLPGPYTFIVKLKNKNSISPETNSGMETIGIRIPDNWFSKIIEESKIPFITTSVNLSGEKPLINLKDLKEEIKNHVDYFINVGEINGKPSTVIDLTNNKKILR